MIVRRPSSQFHQFPVSAVPIPSEYCPQGSRIGPIYKHSGGNMAAKFSHLVVLMMENRSFDHMLGCLYHHDDPIDMAKLC